MRIKDCGQTLKKVKHAFFWKFKVSENIPKSTEAPLLRFNFLLSLWLGIGIANEISTATKKFQKIQ